MSRTGLRARVVAFVRHVARTIGHDPSADATGVPSGPLPATISARPTLTLAAPLGFLGVAAGLLLRRPALVGLGAPSAALVVTGLSTLRRPTRTPQPALASTVPADELGVRASLQLSTSRAVVDDDVTVHVEISALRRVHGCELVVRLPAGMTVTEGSRFASFDIEEGEVRTHSFVVRGSLPGSRAIGPAVLRQTDPFGLTEVEQVATDTRVMHVVPRGEALRTLLRAMHTGGHVGEQISRRRGEGLEFADLRPWVPGDPARRINWRASARRDDPVVIERRPDRNQDVLIVIDAHDDARTGPELSTLERSMEIGAGIASAHLRARDRVGFIGFGSHISWLTPGAGQLQRHRLLDALVSVTTDGRGMGRFVSSLPSTVRPSRAVVVLITPFLDVRSSAVLNDLRAHRYDIAVVIVEPVADPSALVAAEPNGDIAARLWRLRRDDVAWAASTTGCAVSVAKHDTPLEQIVREVMTWRRRMPMHRRSAG